MDPVQRTLHPGACLVEVNTWRVAQPIGHDGDEQAQSLAAALLAFSFETKPPG
jgi:hypothetical protein